MTGSGSNGNCGDGIKGADAMWPANISMEHLRLRAQMLRDIREFFAQRQVLEVETPILSASGTTDPNIESFRTRWSGAGSLPDELYLITSPEFHMKRLLASGSGCIFQLSRVFRQGELGKSHSPEFSLLEWYRVGFDYFQLMAEVEALLRYLFPGTVQFEQTLYMSYRQVFQDYIGVDPMKVSWAALAEVAAKYHYQADSDMDSKDTLLDLIMSMGIQPSLPKQSLVFIYDYPASQAALARLHPQNQDVAQRFELYFQGVELANGFQELTESTQQFTRFQKDLLLRQQQGKATVTPDQHLIAALQNGLPECSGVALGFDRFFQIVTNSNSIDKILAFPINRA